MKRNFTQNDVLRYIYKELSAEENKALEEVLKTNNELRLYYESSLQLIESLEEVKMEPADTTLSILMEYSQSLSLETH